MQTKLQNGTSGCWRFNKHAFSIHICKQQKFLPSSLAKTPSVYSVNKNAWKTQNKVERANDFFGKDIYVVSGCIVKLHHPSSVVRVIDASTNILKLLLRFVFKWIWSQRQHGLEKSRRISRHSVHELAFNLVSNF